MAAKSAGYRKPTGAEQRAIREQLAQAAVDPAVEAHSKEQSFLRAAQTAQDDLIWLINNEAWSALGFDTFADWWDARVSPVLDELPMLRPTREVAQLVIDRVRAEDEARPKSQRRTSKQLAAMVGLSAPTVRRSSSRSLPRSGDAESDLEETPPVIDVEPTNVTDEPTTEPAPADVPDAMTQAITEVTGSVGAGVTMPPARPAESPCSDAPDRAHCARAGCGVELSGNDQNSGHLRCLSCDPSTLHKAVGIGVEEGHGECDECAIQARIAERTSAAVTAGNTEDASPALGEPDVDEQAASTSGTPSSGSEPVGTGLGSGELEERIEEQAAEPAACEACGGLIDADEAHSGNARCEDCDSDGDHIRVLMPDETWGPCRVCHPEERIGELPRTVLVHHADGGAAERAELQAYSDDGRTAKVVYEASDTGVWILVTKIEEIAEDSPAADLIEPSHAGVPAVGVEDSPTSREGDRSETDFPVVLGPDHPVATAVLPGIDHHTSAGVSDSGVAPESGTPTEGGIGADHSVEPVLEGGGLAPDPSSSSNPDHWAIDDGWSAVYDAFDGSDRRHLIVFFDNIDALCDRLDVDVVGPLLTEEEMVHIHKAGDRLAQIAELLEHWRTKQ